MSGSATTVHIARLRQLLAGARARYARRLNRSNTIFAHYRRYYGRAPRLNCTWTLYEEWDGRKRKWNYDQAYLLELEAAITLNWVQRLLHREE